MTIKREELASDCSVHWLTPHEFFYIRITDTPRKNREGP